MRHRGIVVDVAERRVCDRDGAWYRAQQLTVSDAGLYYYRDFPDGTLFSRNEKWILPGPAWVINRFAFLPGRPAPMDWYIEPDLITVADGLWRVRDAFLDLEVHEGARYELLDADELADGLAAYEISLDEAMRALRAIDSLCKALRSNGFSGRALLEEYAPGLPT